MRVIDALRNDASTKELSSKTSGGVHCVMSVLFHGKKESARRVARTLKEL